MVMMESVEGWERVWWVIIYLSTPDCRSDTTPFFEISCRN